MDDGVTVRCWGTRGSVPAPGPATARYGGNTSCVELRLAGGRRLIFDAGTGLRLLGRELADRVAPQPVDLFLTHWHWDHIQGLPFFAPLRDASAVIRIHGPRQDGLGLEAVLRSQMAPMFFPLPPGTLAATLGFRHLEEGDCSIDGVEVAALRVRHPGRTFGYRVRAGGVSIAYVPDDELGPAAYEARARGWHEAFHEFVRDADLLLHDATWLEDEYRWRRGWGHSSVDQAIALAERAGVRTLVLFHHAPDRSDAELDRVLAARREDLAERGAALRLEAAREGAEIAVRPAATPR